MASVERGPVYSVSQITALIKDSLEGAFPSLTVEGEISNFRPASSGHLYFSLKDGEAVLQAVMFRGRASSLSFRPSDGILVRVSGSLSVYAARGAYQIICESMERSGQGAILAMLEERKRALASEGLFDQSRKRPLPPFPERIAVITSPSGAAIRDILSVLSRRASRVSVTILPSAVQGAEAAAELVRMLAIANRHALGEVIILARGGGSIEDLLPFSDETLVRAVAASNIPVISAVGHEIDFPLCDFAADLRAPTPSAAAELVAGESQALLSRVAELSSSLAQSLRATIQRSRAALERFSPEELEYALRNTLQPVMQRLDDAKEDMITALTGLCAYARRRLEVASASIQSSSPRSVLERGYAIVRNYPSGALIRAADGLKPGDRLEISFASGSAIALTEDVKNEEI
jgi:exodeoxyribonuclease VII large subunit